MSVAPVMPVKQIKLAYLAKPAKLTKPANGSAF
jgi:hypothetical protein